MRLLSVHNRYQIRGGEDESREAEERLMRETGHRVDVYEEDNRRVAELGKARTALRTIWSRQTYREVRRMLSAAAAEGQPVDVVHVQNFFPLISPSVYYAARAEGVPVVQTLRNYRLLCPGAYLFRDGQVCESCVGKTVPTPAIAHGCSRHSKLATAAVAAMVTVHKATRTWTDMVDVYVALTEFARRKFVEGGLPAEKIVVKPNFVLPDPGPGAGAGGYAAFVGRLSPEKGVATMLKAWEQLGATLPLKIVGDGPLLKQAREAAGRLTNVECLGRLSAAEAYDVVGGASVLVLPSLWYETFGRVAVEAFAKGTPVVASDLGAMAELVEPGRTGLLFKPGDADDLVRQVRALLSDAAGLARMRVEARREFEAKYTARQNAQQLLDVYERAARVARSRGRRRAASPRFEEALDEAPAGAGGA